MANSSPLGIRNRIVEMKLMKPRDLAEHSRNWRTHPKRQTAAMKGVLNEIGIVDALLAWHSAKNGGRLTMYDGHLRKAVSPNDDWPVLITDLNDSEADYVIATLDNLTMSPGDNAGKMQDLFADVKTMNADVAELLRDASARAGFDNCGKQVRDKKPDEAKDKLAELVKKWGTHRGQRWQCEDHILMCGDATSADDVNMLMGTARGDMCFTSPPYNLGASSKIHSNAGRGPDSLYITDSDDKTTAEYTKLLIAFTELALIHCEFVFVNLQMLATNTHSIIEWLWKNKDKFCDLAIWNKPNAQPAMGEKVMNSAFENIFVFRNKNASRAIGTRPFRGDVSNVINAPPRENNDLSELHKATMPLWLASYCIKQFTNCREIVFDPFGGTGTTMIACRETGRVCRIMEIAPEYAALILERWHLTTNKMPVLITDERQETNTQRC